MSAPAEQEHARCPDNGTCHHDCPPGACFRVHHAAPLDGVWPEEPDGQWPAWITAEYRDGGHL